MVPSYGDHYSYEQKSRGKIIGEQAKSNGKRMLVNLSKELHGVETTMYN